MPAATAPSGRGSDFDVDEAHPGKSALAVGSPGLRRVEPLLLERLVLRQARGLVAPGREKTALHGRLYQYALRGRSIPGASQYQENGCRSADGTGAPGHVLGH